MKGFYAERLRERQSTVAALESKLARIALLRLLVFGLFGVAVWSAIRGSLDGWWIAAPVILFIALLKWNSDLDRNAERARRAVRFHERSIERLEHQWQGKSEDGGVRFAGPHHPYAEDLDIFGRASLFELLSIARTRGGEARLADWLKSPATAETIRARQAAIDELRPMADLREALAVAGDDFRTGVNPDALRAWADGPAHPFPRWTRTAALTLGAITFAALVWFLATDTQDRNARIALVAAGLAEAAFAVPKRKRVSGAVTQVEEPAKDLQLLAEILGILEKQSFHAQLLRNISAAVLSSSMPASEQIHRLRNITDMIESRENPFMRAFGPVLLWTTQLGIAVEAWRAQYGAEVGRWLDAVSDLEALSSLAGYAFEHPDDPFPEIDASAEPVFEAEGLGHPLLAADRCVRNEVALVPPLRLFIVSGSNMSGKSTLLRASGVAAVMALAGAPVRARRLRISPLAVGASIRAVDSLEEGQSRFMSEILRLKQVLELPRPVFFLLDELLGGTNSHDRAIGSEGLVRALVERGGIGMVTTHDLTLARVADALAPLAANVHFEDRLENGRLVFDYRMRPGVVTRSNALDLMRAAGLEV